MNTTCWGRFEENLASNNLSLNGCQGVQKISSSSGAAHAGSTLLVLDLNADTLRDVLIGDVSFTNLVAAYNGGLIDSAFMTSKDTLFPNISPTNIEYFPAAYYEDVNFDAIPDLIVSPNLNGSINQGNTWLYSNNGTIPICLYYWYFTLPKKNLVNSVRLFTQFQKTVQTVTGFILSVFISPVPIHLP